MKTSNQAVGVVDKRLVERATMVLDIYGTQRNDNALNGKQNVKKTKPTNPNTNLRPKNLFSCSTNPDL